MCDKATLENVGTLKPLPYCYKNQEICNKAVENYPHALEVFPGCFKTQKMCDKALKTYLSTIKFFPECVMTQDWYETQEMCDRVFSKDTFLIIFCFCKYKIQTMCDEAVADCRVVFLIVLLQVK